MYQVYIQLLESGAESVCPPCPVPGFTTDNTSGAYLASKLTEFVSNEALFNHVIQDIRTGVIPHNGTEISTLSYIYNELSYLCDGVHSRWSLSEIV